MVALNLTDLTPDQHSAINHIYENDSTLLVADMGAGKTVCAMTAASELLKDKQLKRILVVSTIKVARNVWATEYNKWDQLKCLNVALALGSAADRADAIISDAEMVCINFENLVWYVSEYGIHNFDGLIIDEVSKLKSNGGSNFKALRKIIKKFKWRLTMTGTPVSEDWTGLFGEMLMTDGGASLGRNKTKFLEAHFYPTDYERRNWALIPEQDRAILKKIGSILYHLPDYRHLLPKLIETNVDVPMSAHTEIMYKAFKRDCILKLNDSEIAAPNAAALTGKLQQIAQGFMYGEDGITHKLETHKLGVLKELPSIKNKIPTIIVYWFKQDLDYLKSAFPEAVMLENSLNIDAWNAGTIDILLLQPRSAGHGLNLAQGGSNMVFYSQLWSNDLHKQTIARLWRRGQTRRVNVTHLMLENSIDYIIGARISDKSKYQKLLIKHLTASKL